MSFGWNCMFRKGSWLEFRRFTLLQRKNIPDRILTINKEIGRIGEVSVSYEKSESGVMTEKRKGFEIDSKTSLGKLLIAYIAQGGNPFDISMFLMPDSYKVVEGGSGSSGWSVNDDKIEFTQPYGGCIYPSSEEEEDHKGQDQRGWLPLWKFPPRKLGGSEKNIYPEADEIGGQISIARRWVRQEISQLRNDLEARIIKLCDLREQLIIERDIILYNTLVGSVAALEEFDPDEILKENHLSYIVTNIDLNFFHRLEGSDSMVPDHTKPLPLKTPLSIYQCLLDDVPDGEEENTAL